MTSNQMIHYTLTSAVVSCIIVNLNNIGGSGTINILSIILGIALLWSTSRGEY